MIIYMVQLEYIPITGVLQEDESRDHIHGTVRIYTYYRIKHSLDVIFKLSGV